MEQNTPKQNKTARERVLAYIESQHSSYFAWDFGDFDDNTIVQLMQDHASQEIASLADEINRKDKATSEKELEWCSLLEKRNKEIERLKAENERLKNQQNQNEP